MAVLSVSVRFKFATTSGASPYLDRTFPLTSFTQDNIGGPTPGGVSIGTTEESFTLSELTTKGWLYMENLDANNYVQWGVATGVYPFRMEAGEPVTLRLDKATPPTLYLKANTAACQVLIYAMED